MSDKLKILVVVPPKTLGPRWQEVADTVGIALATVESGFLMAGWDVKLEHQTVTLDKPDGKVYDADYCIRDNQIDQDPQVLADFAKHAFNGTQTAYLILVCNRIVDAKNMTTGWSSPSGTNGATLTGLAITYLALPEGKTTIGDGDGQTWAHEIGHGLGLGHVDQESNLMYAARHGAGGGLAGFGLTAEQIQTMRATLGKLTAGQL